MKIKISQKNIRFPVLLFVYKRNKTTWRGVAWPFDLVCENRSLKKTQQEIQERAKSYIELCKEHNFPAKWMNVEIADKKDKAVLKSIQQDMIKSLEKTQLEEMKKNAKKELKFQYSYTNVADLSNHLVMV